MKKLVRAIVMMGMVLALQAVMAGCGKQAVSSDAASTVMPTDQAKGAVSSNAPKNPVMSQKELELSMLFRGLLQMDNKGELLITKEQAVSMLPIVSTSTEAGEITADNQQKLMALLTPDQKKFIDDMNARFKQFANNRNNPNGNGKTPSGSPRPALTDEQRAQFQKNRDKAGQGQGQGNGGFGGFGQNVEQQLLDLLDKKINN
jgi:ABC-type oligopeptide transport system substrate-binding subunit